MPDRERNYSYWEVSKAVRVGVKTVPLMVPPTNDDNDDNEDEIFNYDEKHGLKSYIPWRVDSHNVGENKGFLEIFTQCNLHSMFKFAIKDYSVLRIDVSIYKQSFEVLTLCYFIFLVE